MKEIIDTILKKRKVQVTEWMMKFERNREKDRNISWTFMIKNERKVTKYDNRIGYESELEIKNN